MVSAYVASFADLFLAVTALELFSFLDPQIIAGAGTAAPALLDGAAEVCWLPAAGALTLFVATVAFMYHHLSRAGVPVAGAASRRRLSGLAIPVLCASVGTLEHVAFVQAHGGAQARALGLAALRALPAAATAAFFLGMMLIVVIAHVRAGGEGGGGAGAARVGPVKRPVRVLTNMAFGAAAALVLLMATAAIHGAK